MKVCPVCKREYPAVRVVCPIHGTVLEEGAVEEESTIVDPAGDVAEALSPLPIPGGPDESRDTDTDVINLDVPTRRMESSSNAPSALPLPPVGEVEKASDAPRFIEAGSDDDTDDVDTEVVPVKPNIVGVVDKAETDTIRMDEVDTDGVGLKEPDTEDGMDEADTDVFKMRAARLSLAALDQVELPAPESESLAKAVTDLITTGKRLQEEAKKEPQIEIEQAAPPEEPPEVPPPPPPAAAEPVGILSWSAGAPEEEEEEGGSGAGGVASSTPKQKTPQQAAALAGSGGDAGRGVPSPRRPIKVATPPPAEEPEQKGGAGADDAPKQADDLPPPADVAPETTEKDVSALLAKIVEPPAIEPTVTETAVPLPPPGMPPTNRAPKVVAVLGIVLVALGVGVLIGRQSSTSENASPPAARPVDQRLRSPDLRASDLRSPDLRSITPDLPPPDAAPPPDRRKPDVAAPATSLRPIPRPVRTKAKRRVKRRLFKKKKRRSRGQRRSRSRLKPRPKPRSRLPKTDVPTVPTRRDGILEDTVDPFK
jgi:hypothetical protein